MAQNPGCYPKIEYDELKKEKEKKMAVRGEYALGANNQRHTVDKSAQGIWTSIWRLCRISRSNSIDQACGLATGLEATLAFSGGVRMCRRLSLGRGGGE